MIKTEKLTINYGDLKGIFDIDMTIPKGKVYALVGKSGCGKSTLLKALASLVEVHEGSFSIGNGLNHENKLGFIQQDDALFPWLNVKKNIEIGFIGQGKIKNSWILDLLESVGLSGCEWKLPNQLSGGERQRVSIARTLATKPEVLLMDEPTAALDAITKEALQNLLMKLHLENPRTTLLVTHSMEEAVFLSDCVFIMDRGRILSKHVIDLPMNGNRREVHGYYDQVMSLKKIFEKEVFHA